MSTLREFKPVLSFLCVQARFLLMQSLVFDLLSVKSKALKLWDLKNSLTSGKIFDVMVPDEIVI